jgi:hypothetical protein
MASPLFINALRPDDFLSLRFEARNLKIDSKDPKNPKLVAADLNQPCYLIVHFPPQSIHERAYFEAPPAVSPQFQPPPDPSDPPGTEPLDPPGHVDCRISGPSRLVFRLPAKFKSIPLTLEALLDWTGFQLAVSPTAAFAGGPPPQNLKIAPPTDVETALELPYRLILSPNADVGWLHARTPVTHLGRTELWHTRMARLVTSKKDPKRKVPQDISEIKPLPMRAIWSPDFVDHGPLPTLFDLGPFRSPMSPGDRDQIVILTAGFNGYYVVNKNRRKTPYVPEPIQAGRVFLSALGGWLTSRGKWDPLPAYDTPAGKSYQLDLSEWRHIATLGRDHYVRIVYEGYLYPFGHRAALVKVTERKFIGADKAPVGSPVAYLRQRMYIVVREPELSYVGQPYTHQGREMPLQSRVRIKTRVTPEIDPPVPIPASTGFPATTASFWVNVGGAGYPFHCVATDLASAKTDFTSQMIFVALSETEIQTVQHAYATSGDRRACKVRSKKIAYANPKAGDTELKTTALYFDTQIIQAAPPFASVPFIPKLDDQTAAAVTIPSLAELLGISPDATIHLYAPYLITGLDSGAGVYAEINTPPPVGFTADKAGGFATLNLSVTGISARKGLVGGSLDDAAAGLIDPAQFFDSAEAKLFGTIPVGKLVPVDAFGKADATQNAPEIRSHFIPNRKHPKQVLTRIKWEPQLKDFSEDPVKIVFNTDGNHSSLVLHSTIQRMLDGTPPTSKTIGKLSNFEVTLFGVIGIKIVAITFTSKNGGKTIVQAKLPAKNPIVFLGPLAFVQTLADVLPPGLFGGAGPAIDLKPTFIRVAYTLGLPPITVGVFALEHIAITTGLDLPYLDGKPGFEFAFASRSKPFLILVECLGGGGFIHLVLNADGIQMVEGALEFGGSFSIDFGVASGGVHIMAGIYFQLKGSSSELTGFVDIGGEVSVLGIISISIDLNLSLSYIHSPQGDKVRGRATLTISVHIVFFSISVSVSVERSFGSGNGDPRVKQLIGQDDWAAYAAAFA